MKGRLWEHTLNTNECGLAEMPGLVTKQEAEVKLLKNCFAKLPKIYLWSSYPMQGTQGDPQSLSPNDRPRPDTF